MQNFGKYTLALALGLGFVIAPALSSLFTAQAQDWRYRQDRGDDRREREQRRERRGADGYGQNDSGQVDRNGNVDRNQNGVDDRYENNRNGNVDRNGNIDLNRNGIDDRYENNGRYGDRRGENNGRYGNDDRHGNDGYGNGNYGGYGYRFEIQRGYRDGLIRGQEDARSGDPFNPNNSGRYRRGNAEYREGFFRGYNRGYRLYDNRGQYGRRW